MPPTKVDHTNTICCICGNNYTSSVWYKNDKDNWDRKSYRCAKCNSKIKRSEIKETKKKDIKSTRENIKCCKCDIDTTNTNRYKYYNEKGEWNKWSYLCRKCYRQLYYSPTQEEKQRYRNEKFKDRKCCICGKIESSNWHKCLCDKVECKGYICGACYVRDYNEFIKSNRLSRTGNVAVGSSQYMTIVSQAVVAKYLNIEDLNIKMDNFEWYIDMENDVYGKIDVKSGRLTIVNIYDAWEFGINRKIDSHVYFCIGFSRDLKVIDVVYIIPNEGWICNLEMITIHKYPTRGSKYDQFKVDNKPYNDIYQELLRFLKDKKFIGVDDIKEWSNTYNEENK
jgi:hypothetical protein